MSWRVQTWNKIQIKLERNCLQTMCHFHKRDDRVYLASINFQSHDLGYLHILDLGVLDHRQENAKSKFCYPLSDSESGEVEDIIILTKRAIKDSGQICGCSTQYLLWVFRKSCVIINLISIFLCHKGSWKNHNRKANIPPLNLKKQ